MRTYVVRIQEPRPSEDGGDGLHGVAEEIATGRQVRFASTAELLKVFGPQDDQPGVATPLNIIDPGGRHGGPQRSSTETPSTS